MKTTRVISALFATWALATGPALSAGGASASPEPVTQSGNYGCSASVDDPHWSSSFGTVHAKVRINCSGSGTTQVRIDGFFGFASGGKCGSPAYGPYSRLYEGSQWVSVQRGVPSGPTKTVYLPARHTNPKYGASGTYHASMSAYIDNDALMSAGGEEEALQEASGFINSASNTKYVGGQCQG